EPTIHVPLKEKEKFVHFVVTDSAKADSCTLCVTLPLGLMCPVNVWDFAVLITIPGHRSIIFGSVSYVCKKPSSVSLLEKTPTSASGITDKETYCSCWAKCGAEAGLSVCGSSRQNKNFFFF
uniref:Uncharacterized protein n=1 Tax=Neovison vison TaxID=452646 RepID=A0A8C7A5K1_NEOVI